ncbi:hypothetical protein [Peribacillus loiseleuriae]|uniref:Uncharacterized protein n=1 Tax=Peribacillus loiseleuriae TaxID=1679170 RepID=A0A0K9GY60_9BACI|nr:hypothetical protein [Peribacillus loiseleuriae]KMY51593.1 hypothetical protein AC625_20270 [Peribacillus loiseleuriae]
MIVAFVVILVISTFLIGNDKKQIISEMENHSDDIGIQHIEVLDGNKSVAFIKKDDGTEKEMYFGKTLFSWKFKRDYIFYPEGVNEPVQLSFFQSPFTKEETLDSILLRVFDNEISRVRIKKGDNIIHDFELLPKGSGKRFGLFRTDSNDVYDAEYIAYNSEGEVVYAGKPGEQSQ